VSIAGYLNARKTEARMPKGVDQLSIQYEGAVLVGEKSVEERLKEGAVRAQLAVDEYCGGVEDYDPVLRSHCG
jgi:hypothetical protein